MLLINFAASKYRVFLDSFLKSFPAYEQHFSFEKSIVVKEKRYISSFLLIMFFYAAKTQ